MCSFQSKVKTRPINSSVEALLSDVFRECLRDSAAPLLPENGPLGRPNSIFLCCPDGLDLCHKSCAAAGKGSRVEELSTKGSLSVLRVERQYTTQA